jgi:hypothetical protein
MAFIMLCKAICIEREYTGSNEQWVRTSLLSVVERRRLVARAEAE